MATDAETIAQLQAERAELLRRIDAAESTLSALRDAAVAEAARHATASERARCLAAATRVGAFAACDEMLRDAPDAGETPPQAYGRGMAEGRRLEREECAALVLDAAEEYATPLPGTDAHDLDRNSHAADVLRWVAEDIRARGSQEPPQRPEVPGDVATPAPVAPSPARGLPVAAAFVEAAGVCERMAQAHDRLAAAAADEGTERRQREAAGVLRCAADRIRGLATGAGDAPGQAWERGRLAGLDEAAAILRAEADARAAQRGGLSQHDVVACDRTVGALRRVAFMVEGAKALVSATKDGGR